MTRDIIILAAAVTAGQLFGRAPAVLLGIAMIMGGLLWRPGRKDQP